MYAYKNIWLLFIESQLECFFPDGDKNTSMEGVFRPIRSSTPTMTSTPSTSEPSEESGSAALTPTITARSKIRKRGGESESPRWFKIILRSNPDK